jgi:hypothetical protein
MWTGFSWLRKDETDSSYTTIINIRVIKLGGFFTSLELIGFSKYNQPWS